MITAIAAHAIAASSPISIRGRTACPQPCERGCWQVFLLVALVHASTLAHGILRLDPGSQQPMCAGMLVKRMGVPSVRTGRDLPPRARRGEEGVASVSRANRAACCCARHGYARREAFGPPRPLPHPTFMSGTGQFAWAGPSVASLARSTRFRLRS